MPARLIFGSQRHNPMPLIKSLAYMPINKITRGTKKRADMKALRKRYAGGMKVARKQLRQDGVRVIGRRGIVKVNNKRSYTYKHVLTDDLPGKGYIKRGGRSYKR